MGFNDLAMYALTHVYREDNAFQAEVFLNHLITFDEYETGF